jgi:hypothetical protein
MICQSPAAIAIEDTRPQEAETNAKIEQRFTGRGMRPLWYQKAD